MEKAKITFGPDYTSQPSAAAIDLTVIAEEIRKSFSLGFDKAMEFYQTMTQPQVATLNRSELPPEFSDAEETEMGPGMLDLNSLYQMSPEAREAVLSRYGLTAAGPAPREPDPTHSVVAGLTKNAVEEPESEEL